MGSYNWNWPILLKEPYFGWIVSGFGKTILIAVLAWADRVPAGLGDRHCAHGRQSRAALRRHRSTSTSSATSRCWCRCSSGTSSVPELLPADWGRWVKRDMPYPQFLTAVTCLGLYTASRVAEQVRSGIEAIPRGQRNAGLAMGLTPLQVYRYVLIPVAYRTIIPPLTSDFLGVFKNSLAGADHRRARARPRRRARSRSTPSPRSRPSRSQPCSTALVTGLVILIMRIVEQRTRIAGAIAVGAQ